jgi:hypothetical protein
VWEFARDLALTFSFERLYDSPGRPEQLAQVDAVLDQDRPVEPPLAADLLADLGRRLLAHDGRRGIARHGADENEHDERDRPEHHGKEQQSAGDVGDHFAQLAA